MNWGNPFKAINGRAVILGGLGGVLVVLTASLAYLRFFDSKEQISAPTNDMQKAGTIATEPLPVGEVGEIINGIHTATGFKTGDGLDLVIANCTACHSSKLVIQNRATREGWESMIQWMQETQNFWDLGPNQDVILNYLARNYAPENKGRRANLENIEWYELED